jgi:hypothetical protein
VLHPELVGELAHRRHEPLIAQDDGLDVEGEVAQGADRLAVLLDRGADDPARASKRSPTKVRSS